MNGAIENQKICRNGHLLPNGDSKFCVYCGVPLEVSHPSPSNSQFVEPQVSTATPPFQTSPFQMPPAVQNRNNVNLPPPVQQNLVIGAASLANFCRTCGGDGHGLAPAKVVCSECGWLRPLAPGYAVDPRAFQWAEDGKAMSALRSVKALNSAAQAISNKVGRRWIEATFNGILLGERQLPEIYAHAVLAARILGMSNMPDVYVSGDHMWDCFTYGTDKDSFIVVGTALITNFRDDELVFLFAREMGHCRAGHALWKTVMRFLVGEQSQHKGLMANGLFSAFSLSALVEGAIEVPLLAWARQAEITADRAGLLAVGDREIVRRVLLTWSLKSMFLYRQINIEAWLEQQSASDTGFTKLSELATSSTPYITRRLKLMEEFAAHPELIRQNALIRQFIPKRAAAPAPVKPAAAVQKKSSSVKSPVAASAAPAAEELKLNCAFCHFVMRVPLKVLNGKTQIALRCPNKQCGKVTNLKRKANSVIPASAGNSPQVVDQK